MADTIATSAQAVIARLVARSIMVVRTSGKANRESLYLSGGKAKNLLLQALLELFHNRLDTELTAHGR